MENTLIKAFVVKFMYVFYVFRDPKRRAPHRSKYICYSGFCEPLPLALVGDDSIDTIIMFLACSSPLHVQKQRSEKVSTLTHAHTHKHAHTCATHTHAHTHTQTRTPPAKPLPPSPFPTQRPRLRLGENAVSRAGSLWVGPFAL